MTDMTATGLGARDRPNSEKPVRLSALLTDLANESSKDISLGEIAAAMADRSFGAFLIVFCIPNLIPMPPGATLLLGIPLILISWQIIFSRSASVWLPKRIANISFSRETFGRGIKKIGPWLEWAEAWIRPRYWSLTTRTAERLFGLYCLLLAIVVFLPIPFGNWLPALSLAIIGFGMMEKDGVSLLAGVAVGLLSILVACTVLAASLAVIVTFFGLTSI
jgi:hypothetical protein